MFGAYNEDIGAASQTLVLTEVKLCLRCRLEKIVITSFKSHHGGGGVLLGILGGDVSPSSSNPDPISDQKMSFFTSVFRHGL